MNKAWRSPAFRIQALAMLVAAFAVTAMLQLGQSIDQRFNQRTAVALGADLVLEGTAFPEPQQLTLLGDLKHAQTVSFASVLLHDEQFLLASVRAVSTSFPLYGSLQISDQRFASPYSATAGPGPGEVWLAGAALDRLGLAVGATVTLGSQQLTVSQVLVQEPDQQAGFYSMNPRALINLQDLERLNVLGPGSRYRHKLLVAVAPEQRDRLEARLAAGLRPDQELETVLSSEFRNRGAIRQLFLWSQLAVMLIVLLCAAAVFLTAGQRARQQQTLCAVMKTVGASQRQIAWRLLGTDLRALLLPVIAGVALATLLGRYLAQLLDSQFSLSANLLIGALAPLLLWAGYVIPSLRRQLSLPASELLRGENAVRRTTSAALLIGVLTPVPLAALLSGSWQQLWPLLLLTYALGLGLPLLLWPLLSLADRFSASMSLPARLALRRLSRRPASTLPLLAALVVAFAVLSLSLQGGRELLSQWRTTLPEQAPNYFVINLFDQDRNAFARWLDQQGSTSQPLYPVVRARLTAINDEPVHQAVTKENDRAERALNRDLSLTEASELPDSNRLLEGHWPDQPGEVTVESKLAESLGLALGDRLTFSGSLAPIQARITGFREVDWESFAPNFYFMFSPDSLQEQQRTWITSFYLPEDRSSVLSGLVNRFPQISLLDVNAILATLQALIAQASLAALLIGLLMVSAALLVMGAALLAALPQLRQDNRLLVVVGASRTLLRRTTLLQALFLMGSAALLSNLVHLAALWPLGQRLFDGALPLSLWLLLPWGGCGLLMLLAVSLPPLLPVTPRQRQVRQQGAAATERH